MKKEEKKIWINMKKNPPLNFKNIYLNTNTNNILVLFNIHSNNIWTSVLHILIWTKSLVSFNN